jgi:hypothetical protein
MPRLRVPRLTAKEMYVRMVLVFIPVAKHNIKEEEFMS